MAGSVHTSWPALLEIGTHNILRILVPGSILVGFIIWRYPRLNYLAHDLALLAVAIVVLGFIWYAIHRALVLSLWRRLELQLVDQGSFPQYNFHIRMVKKARAGKRQQQEYRFPHHRAGQDIREVTDCCSDVIKGTDEDKKEILFLNTLSHILQMNTELFFLFALSSVPLGVLVAVCCTWRLLKECCALGLTATAPMGAWWVLMWITFALIFCWSAIQVNKEADSKEVAMLRRNVDTYQRILELYMMYPPQ